MSWKIFNEDVVKWAREYDGEPFHALLSDPPYHLTSIVKRFGKSKIDDGTKTSEKVSGRVDGYSRLIATGFMGQTWDGGDVAFQPETWYEISKVLYPGAFGMAYSAARNWHRLAVAIEDAGFIIHPSIFGWVSGQGFPKATNIEKQLDENPEMQEAWKGRKYGLQALKPAVEPIIVFQKPYEGRPIENIVNSGAGALNIDGGRIPLENDDEYTINTFDDGAKPFGNGAGHKYSSKKVRVPQSNPNNRKGVVGTDLGISNSDIEDFQRSQRESIERLEEMGRYPANFIISDDLAERLDSQSGGVSKFFFRVSEQVDESDPIYYCSKVSVKERNAGLEEKNPHPTLKPISLSKYLATILMPPDAYSPRRILIPFSGVASEMIGSLLAGWEEVVGVENDTKNGYVDIAEKRIEYWTSK